VLLALLTVPLLSTATGCLGPIALQRTRGRYNEAIQRTSDEQLLLNLVRLRYRDTPSFMELSSVSTLFTFEEGAFADGHILEGPTTPDFLNFGATVRASERPTVTYDPLGGQEFVKRLVSPLSEETIILLTRSGWSISRVLRMTVQELNGLENARRASGPTPHRISEEEFTDFKAAVEDLREMQVAGEIDIGYEDRHEPISGPVAPESIDGDASVNAAKEGWRIEPRQERVMVPLSKIEYGSNATANYLDAELLGDYVRQIESETLRKPIRVRFRDADPDQDKGRVFVIVPGELGDLRLQAYREAYGDHSQELVPCIVEYPDEYVINRTNAISDLELGSGRCGNRPNIRATEGIAECPQLQGRAL
jgi:hypothetical protein